MFQGKVMINDPFKAEVLLKDDNNVITVNYENVFDTSKNPSNKKIGTRFLIL